jgi:hypothetical protein
VIGLGTVGSLVGCQRSQFELAPTQGTVNIAGKPLKAGKVMFAPVTKGDRLNAGKPAMGAIKDGGQFTLTTYKDGDGAIVGQHWVTIYGPNELAGATPLKSADGRKIECISVPGMVEVVSGKQNQVDIELTAQEMTQFAQWSD